MEIKTTFFKKRNKKLALLLTGFPHYYDKTFPKLIDILRNQNFDVDVYLSSWSKYEDNFDPHRLFDNINVNKKIIQTDIENIKSFYGKYLKNYHFIDYDNYFENKEVTKLNNNEDLISDVFVSNNKEQNIIASLFWKERLKDQWYCVRQGWNLIDPYQNEYDIVMKTRFDIYYSNLFIQEKSEKLFFLASDVQGRSNELADYMWYGNPSSVKKCCSMYDYIEEMYYKDNQNIALAEPMLTFYLKKINIKNVIDKNIKYERLTKKV